MDKRLLLLLLGLSLLLDVLQAIKCHKCNYVNRDGTCRGRRTFCHANGRHQCILKVYHGGNMNRYAYQDCRHLCIPKVVDQGNNRVDILCCKDRDFCNEF